MCIISMKTSIYTYIKWYHIEYRISVNKMMRKYFQQIKTLRIEHNIFQRLVDIIISHANN